ncbi:pirin family protein [Mucilaginibacter endophyticus]|uniref:pirin family protein n=1 Tax=Mucilaginibacter endophyticus TaxID=2675003 RepID=UPI00137ADB62|nr:pirin family protein [Mucilaginibacter endophyticus]
MTSELKQSRIVKLAQTGNASFSAFRANRNDYAGLSSPIMGFDHFRLSSDVFGPHQHRHMSAVSYLFDDSAPYHNQDSMGEDLTISTGSLLWTWAGSGVTHHEFPEEPNAKIHGLQLFLEIPAETRNLPPKSILIPVEKMPVSEAGGIKVKVVMGSTNGLINPIKTPEDITFLDIKIEAGKNFKHLLPSNWNGTVYLLSGGMEIETSAGKSLMNTNDTLAFGSADDQSEIVFKAGSDSHLLFISGHPVA